MIQCGDSVQNYDESEYIRGPYCNDHDEINYVELLNGICPECEGS